MTSDSLTALQSVFAVAGPIMGFGLLLFNFVVSCGPVGYPPGETPPRGFQYLIVEWEHVGIAYGNGCELTYHPLLLFAAFALIVAGILSIARIWRTTE